MFNKFRKKLILILVRFVLKCFRSEYLLLMSIINIVDHFLEELFILFLIVSQDIKSEVS